MAVTHTTVGFKGTVDQIGEAKRLAKLGPRGTVADGAAWKVSAAAGDRVVSVAAGSGQACGVDDTTVAVDTLPSLPAHAAASTVYRYDMIVARWKWTDPVTAVEFVTIPGISGASGPDLTKLVRTPGTQYDLLLAVVRVAGGQGTLSANDITDARVWGGSAGSLLLASMTARNWVDRAGSVRIADATRPQVVYAHDGTRWVQEGLNADVGLAPAGSYVGEQTGTAAPTVTGGAGTIFFDLARPFTGILWGRASIGDATGPVAAAFAPGTGNGTRQYFTTYLPGGGSPSTGDPVRVTYAIAGWNT